MSYDLMVFEPSAAPRDPDAFLQWYLDQTQWREPHSYNDPKVTSPSLKAWFFDMIKTYPAMNGPYRFHDYDHPRPADYCIGTVVIYVAFTSSSAVQAYADLHRLAEMHEVGVYDASEDGKITFPSDDQSIRPV